MISAFERAFGDEIGPEESANGVARSLLALLIGGEFQYARLTGLYRDSIGVETVKFEVDVERPQKPAVAIAHREPMAARFCDNSQPTVFALRPDFPTETLHLNLGEEGWPPWLCLDETLWAEARSRWTALRFVERIRWWLAATARGDLHGEDQPAEPLFLPGIGVIVPGDLLTDEWNDSRILELHALNQDTTPVTIVLSEGSPRKAPTDAFWPIFLTARPQPMQRLRSAPANLEQLHNLLTGWGIDLIELLRNQVAQLQARDPARLSCRPLLLLHVPLLRPDGSPSREADVKAFSTKVPFDLARIGIALGAFLDAGNAARKFGGVVRRLPIATDMRGSDIPAVTLSVYPGFTRHSAELGSGLAADTRAITLVGAGAIGSHLLEILRRDGFGAWTVVDNDAFLPHNIQRHRLGEQHVGASKATAIAEYLNSAIGSPGETKAICANVLRPERSLDEALIGAEVLVNSSASIAVARYLSDLKGVTARRLSVFFNAAGRDVVLLCEDRQRSVALDALEAQYYRLSRRAPKSRTR